MKQVDAGESLVELIVAMAILGTTMVTIVGGFLNLSRLSGRQRDQGVAFMALTAGSEYAKNRACAAAGSCSAEPAVACTLVALGAECWTSSCASRRAFASAACAGAMSIGSDVGPAGRSSGTASWLRRALSADGESCSPAVR